MPSPTIWSISFVYCNCRKRGARYKSKRCAPGSSKSALAFVKLRAASAFISPRAGLGKPCSANSRSPSIPVNRLLRRQSVCRAPQGRSLLQKPSSSSPCSTSYLLRSFNASRDDSNAKKPTAERQNLNSHELSGLGVCAGYAHGEFLDLFRLFTSD